MGTHYAGGAGEVRALDAYIKILRASESVIRRATRHLSAVGLTVSQFGVLEAIFHLGPLCGKDLAGKLLKSGGNIATVVDNLERAGLVRRERSPENRRFVRIHLTADGRRLISRIFPRHVESVVREMGVLSAREQEGLAALCRRLGRGARA